MEDDTHECVTRRGLKRLAPIQALPSLNVFESVAELDRYLAGIQKKVREEGA